MDDKRERILNAAFHLFKQFGFLKTTVDEIARSAQVGKGTVYFYFKNKEDILLSLVEREFSIGIAEIGKAMDQVEKAEEKLRVLFQSTFRFFHSNELVSKVLSMDQGLALSAITEKNKAYQSISINTFMELLDQGQKDGVFRPMNNGKVAFILDNLIRSFHYMHILGFDLHSPEDILEPLIDLVLKGLEKQ